MALTGTSGCPAARGRRRPRRPGSARMARRRSPARRGARPQHGGREEDQHQHHNDGHRHPGERLVPKRPVPAEFLGPGGLAGDGEGGQGQDDGAVERAPAQGANPGPGAEEITESTELGWGARRPLQATGRAAWGRSARIRGRGRGAVDSDQPQAPDVLVAAVAALADAARAGHCAAAEHHRPERREGRGRGSRRGSSSGHNARVAARGQGGPRRGPRLPAQGRIGEANFGRMGAKLTAMDVRR